MPRHTTSTYQDFLVRFGRNVRRARTAAGYTQEGLAEMVDLHPRMIPKIEAAQTNLLATTVARIQAALDCPWSQLMPRVEVKRPRRRRIGRK